MTESNLDTHSTQTKGKAVIPQWVKDKDTKINTFQGKLFNFPEGETIITIDVEQPPKDRDFGSPELPRIRSVYTANIDGKEEKFVPSLTLEKMIISMLNKGYITFIINRTGKTMNNTQYNVYNVKS